ncbi:retron Eco8 family effector endonuclease [Pectobacterium brasiliense]|uniref:retron Eco8 family effector endonuclease n=1 Tax=Pectobacterium brasiliense TaxID=180957 RepID=UPI0019694066|nr:retron Eco8 family effector endonuclease [Pectobacterium brasiliense]MBN3125716.1 AAA family ATPase [Pectobacterium brasiliense]QSD22408.1 AAA family ATPase [Pectobacterium brasiliense]
MTIKSIKIENLLSYDVLIINRVSDLNCIIGKNNVGKSNLLKLLSYFYRKIYSEKCLPPELHSKYSSYGTISIEYDLTRIKNIVTSNRDGKSDFFKHIYNTFFKGSPVGVEKVFFSDKETDKSYTLKLIINKDDSISWSTKNENEINLIGYIFPFFEIETRHIDLYDWDKLWELISRLKSFKVNNIEKDEIIDFINDKISPNSNAYKDFISKVQDITKVSSYSYREKVLNYVKIGLNGQKFNVRGNELITQSDGTNSSEYLSIFLKLLISLTRREYISPVVYIDEPETGLHPKANENLIYELYQTCELFKKKSDSFEKGKYATPLPNIFIATHSSNIVKYIIKYFRDNHQILHFRMSNSTTRLGVMKSTYDDRRFLNIFNDNEARLFFSDMILFVEGDTELEALSNFSLGKKFPHLNLIELYQASSNVYLENLNPNRSRLSIPYLYLFDRDKTVQYEVSSRQCKILLQGNGNLFSLKPASLDNEIKYYKKGYSSDFRDQVKVLTEIKESEGLFLKINNKTLEFDNQGQAYVGRLFSQIDKYLLRKNILILNSTFEECLINETSVPIFLKWLENKKGINANDVLDYINEKKYLNNKILATYLRLIFNGKSDVGVGYKNIDKNKANKFLYSNSMLKITEKNIYQKDWFTGKTGGWVTSFLDFAISHIDKQSLLKSTTFESDFSLIFPEFYSMLEKLRLDRIKGVT